MGSDGYVHGLGSGAGFTGTTVSPLHTNEFHSESTFISPFCS